jgi:hypothetical protein
LNSNSEDIFSYLPNLILNEHNIFENNQIKKLSLALNNSINNYINSHDNNPFGDIMVTFPIHEIFVHKSSNPGGEDKFFVGPNYIKSVGKNYIVYSAGTNGHVEFEQCNFFLA